MPYLIARLISISSSEPSGGDVAGVFDRARRQARVAREVVGQVDLIDVREVGDVDPERPRAHTRRLDEVLGRLDVPDRPNVFVIRNGYLKEGWVSVKRNTVYIAARSLDALMQSAVYGDMYRIYLATRRDRLAYHLAFIPESFDAQPSEPFDSEYMTELFNLGYEMAKDGYPWKSAPPGYDVELD